MHRMTPATPQSFKDTCAERAAKPRKMREEQSQRPISMCEETPIDNVVIFKYWDVNLIGN